MSQKSRYREESGFTILDISLKNARQLFDARDPAPFRDRDIDDDAVKYIVSSVEEFHIGTPMKLVIHFSEESRETLESAAIKEAVHSFFSYESDLLRRKLRLTLRTGRLFLLIGLFTLFTCLGLAEFIGKFYRGGLLAIVREGLVISGWVAMWRPIELFLYDWWPLAEKKRYYDKLSSIQIEITTGPSQPISNS